MVQLVREAGLLVLVEVEFPDLVQRCPGELRAIQADREVRPVGKGACSLDGWSVGILRQGAFERREPTCVVANECVAECGGEVTNCGCCPCAAGTMNARDCE